MCMCSFDNLQQVGEKCMHVHSSIVFLGRNEYLRVLNAKSDSYKLPRDIEYEIKLNAIYLDEGPDGILDHQLKPHASNCNHGKAAILDFLCFHVHHFLRSVTISCNESQWIKAMLSCRRKHTITKVQADRSS